jgi:glycosyltransferase involved in cell wall biosynthesis
MKNIFANLFFSLQAKWLNRFEQKAIAGVDYVITCSTNDSAILREFRDSPPVATVPNGVDTEYFTPTQEGDNSDVSLVFVGGLNWYPNRDALQWFDACIFPLVLADFPEIKLHIIGQSIDIPWRHRESIVCHGSVPDIRPFMTRSAVFIVPLRIGGGTRLKILNAMAMEVAVVSTIVGAEGLQVTDKEDICLAGQEQDFARAVIRLARDANKRLSIGEAARRTVLYNYNWNRIGAKLRSVYVDMFIEHGGN